MLLYMQTGMGFVYNLERTVFAKVNLPDNRLFGEGLGGGGRRRGGLMAARCNASIQISTDSIIRDEMKISSQYP